MRVLAKLGSARIPLQIDIGFGDVVTPAAEDAELPTILDFSSPRLKVYPRETVVAEKVQAMVFLGFTNTRMKDFYDVIYLARHFDFDGRTVVNALKATFDRRHTPLPDGLPLALTVEFANDESKQIQWRSFLRKSGLRHDPQTDLPSVIEDIRLFVARPLKAAFMGAPFDCGWPPSGPWTCESDWLG